MNITLSADDDLIARARQRAESSGISLNQAFRQWLLVYVQDEGPGLTFDHLMADLEQVRAGRRFSRDEANAR